MLANFRAWLQNVAVPPPVADGNAATPPLDLHTLLAQFVALRHEVNLQTRSSRAQQEQSADMLRHLGEALEALRTNREPAGQTRTQDQDEAVRPLLKTLIDLYDALALAGREVQRVEQSLLPSLAEITSTPEPVPPALVLVDVPVDQLELPFWARLLGVHRAVRRLVAARQPALSARQQAEVARVQAETEACRQRQARAEQAVGRVRQVLSSVVIGYTMSVQRIERALQQYDLEPIACVGEPFDPERMEAVEVVSDPGRAATEVIEEVRRGYLWQGRVFRYAQVRVARP